MYRRKHLCVEFCDKTFFHRSYDLIWHGLGIDIAVAVAKKLGLLAMYFFLPMKQYYTKMRFLVPILTENLSNTYRKFENKFNVLYITILYYSRNVLGKTTVPVQLSRVSWRT